MSDPAPTPTTIRLPPAVRDEAARRAKAERRSFSQWIVMAVEEKLERLAALPREKGDDR